MTRLVDSLQQADAVKSVQRTEHPTEKTPVLAVEVEDTLVVDVMDILHRHGAVVKPPRTATHLYVAQPSHGIDAPLETPVWWRD